MKAVKGITLAGSLVLLAACGRGRSTSPQVKVNTPPINDTPEVPTPSPSPTPTPTPSPTPSPTPEPETSPTPEPEIIADSNPMPPAKNDSAPAMSTIAVTNVETNTEQNGNISLTWNSNATHFRVLFWDTNGSLHQLTTQSQHGELASNIASSGGQFVIVAFDTLGNSLFSAPTNVEAL